ncbi:ABC transporter substrate-binding protein [Desulfobotulus mexicanus]|nr:ABC transporter substrate-binding protein [Desulfobotulus mexicanus]
MKNNTAARWPFLLLSCLTLTLLNAPPLSAESNTGITDTQIRIGQSCSLTGPAMGLCKGMRDGAQLYFDFINSQGGIHGRQLKLITEDDAYNPEKCRKNTESFINDQNIFLLFGYVGTPTTEAVLPLIQEKNFPLFAPLTGARIFRYPVINEVFNIRASYIQETETMVDRLVKDRGIKKIAVFYQNDSYGTDGLNGVRIAASKHGIIPSDTVSYNRESPDTEKAVSQLMKSNPEAVILIATSEPAAQVIAGMRSAGSEAVFLNVSFVNGEDLAERLINHGIGVVVSQVVPFPFYRRVPLVAEYNQVNSELSPAKQADFAGMEGFTAAKALSRILSETPAPLTREAFMKSAELHENTDIGGFSFSFNKERRQGSDLVYLTQIGPGGFLRPIENLNQLYQFHPN